MCTYIKCIFETIIHETTEWVDAVPLLKLSNYRPGLLCMSLDPALSLEDSNWIFVYGQAEYLTTSRASYVTKDSYENIMLQMCFHMALK